MKRNERRAGGLFILDGIRTRDLSPQYKRGAAREALHTAASTIPGPVWGADRFRRFYHVAAHEKTLLKGH